ncbi:MAG: hypothetical protein ACPIOQ_09270 [Promethearchaeia archaeon]
MLRTRETHADSTVIPSSAHASPPSSRESVTQRHENGGAARNAGSERTSRRSRAGLDAAGEGGGGSERRSARNARSSKSLAQHGWSDGNSSAQPQAEVRPFEQV